MGGLLVGELRPDGGLGPVPRPPFAAAPVEAAAASVLIAFDDLLASKRVARGDLVVLVVFGGGLSWAATLIRI